MLTRAQVTTFSLFVDIYGGEAFLAICVNYRDVVQLVVCVLWEHEVAGSSPVIPTIPC